MILGPVIVGALTAYYFGLKAGGIAAIASFALFFLGIIMPSKLLYTYGAVAVYLVGVVVIGPRLPGQKKKKADLFRFGRKSTGTLLRLYRRIRK